jgi:hypothetical protein
VVDISDAHQFNDGVIGADRRLVVVRRDEEFVTVEAEDRPHYSFVAAATFFIPGARGGCQSLHYTSRQEEAPLALPAPRIHANSGEKWN